MKKFLNLKKRLISAVCRPASQAVLMTSMFLAACAMEPVDREGVLEQDGIEDHGGQDDRAGGDSATGIISPTELAPGWQSAARADATDLDSDAGDGISASAIIITIPPKYSAVFRQGSGHLTVSDLEWADFSTAWQQHSNNGYRLIDLDSTVTGGVRRYTGVFQPGSGGYALWSTSDWASFSDTWETWSNQGLRLVDLEIHVDNGVRVYTGVYRAGTDGHFLWVGVDWNSFVNKWTELAGVGLRLVDIEVWEENGQLRYAGVWRGGTDGYALWVGADWNNFAKKWMELSQSGLRLVDLEAYTFNGSRLYAGVYRTGSGVYDLVGAASKSVLDQKIAALAAEGKQPISIEYEWGQDMPPPGLAAAFHDVIDGHAAGYSFAVAESGVITSNGGFGYARSPHEAVDPSVSMTGSKRSHIASVSKPITAVAIMNLLEVNPGITLDTPFIDIIGDQFNTVAAGVGNVTLRNLLQHRSGMKEWGYCGPDLHTSMASLVASPMVNPIGTPQYSNGNFCLLRMVVEELSGMSYVSYVRNNILSPMGISAMSCTPDTSKPTLYYKRDALTSAGFFWSDDYSGHCGAYGWYASALDLARFLIGVRQNTVLTATSTNTLLTQGLGWFSANTVNGTARHHNGAWITGDGRGYNGAIVRLPNNTEAVVLINTNGYLNDMDYFTTVGTLVDGYNRMQSY